MTRFGSLSPPSERSDVLVRCVSVFLSVVRSGTVHQTSLKRALNANIDPKRLKLPWTSNLTRMFPGTVRTRPRKFFLKRAWPGSRDPLFLGR